MGGYSSTDTSMLILINSVLRCSCDLFISPNMKTPRSRKYAHLVMILLTTISHVFILFAVRLDNKMWCYVFAVTNGLGFSLSFMGSAAEGDPTNVKLAQKRMSYFGQFKTYGFFLRLASTILYEGSQSLELVTLIMVAMELVGFFLMFYVYFTKATKYDEKQIEKAKQQ